MRTNPSAQVLYVMGWWAWLYRIPALVVYAMVPPLLVTMYFTAQDFARHPSISGVGAILFQGLFFLIAWVFWRYLQSMATRIIFFPDRALLIVRTLNFTSRHIPIANLEDVRYEEESNSETDARIPLLRVQARGGMLIKIDLEGRVLDEEAFKAIFHSYMSGTSRTGYSHRTHRAHRA